MNKKLLRFIAPLFALALFAGCNNESSESSNVDVVDNFYDDVGELDIDTRDHYVRRNNLSTRKLRGLSVPAPLPAPEHYAKNRSRHGESVGEMELDQ